MKHQLIVRCNSMAKELEWPENYGAFQIVQFVSGHGITLTGKSMHILSPGDLCFTRPREIRMWSLAPDSTINYCGIWPEFLVGNPHIKKLLETHAAFSGHPLYTSMNERQCQIMRMLFHIIHDEAESCFEDKNDVILLHIQMMMLHLNRFSEITDTSEKYPSQDVILTLLSPLLDKFNGWIYN